MSYENIENGTGGGLPEESRAPEEDSPTMLKRLRDTIPDNVNLDILDPDSAHPVRERFYLLNEYRQPWSSFFNINEFNLPIFSEYKTRFRANVGAFFYNYFIIACLYFLVYAILNFKSVLILGAYAGLGYLLYKQFPDDINVGGICTISSSAKLVIMLIAGFFAVTSGGVLTLLFSALFFLVFVVGIHASIREHEV